MIERTFIQQGIRKMELEQFIAKKLERAGFTHLDLIKTPLVTRIVLHVTKPGLAIGKGGQTINQLTENVSEKYKIDNPQIEIQEIANPMLDARATVDKMATLIQREFPWRSVAFRTVRDIMGAGAQGVELVMKGKLSGKAGRKRKQRIAFGYMKKVGDQAKYVDYAKASAYPKAGAIGIKLRVIHPNTVFPDKINVNDVVESIKGPKEEPEELTEEERAAKTGTEEKITEKAEENKEEEKAGKSTAEKEEGKKEMPEKEVKEKEAKAEEKKSKEAKEEGKNEMPAEKKEEEGTESKAEKAEVKKPEEKEDKEGEEEKKKEAKKVAEEKSAGEEARPEEEKKKEEKK